MIMSNCKYTEEMLKEARDAYHHLLTGKTVVTLIDQNGERIEFQKANATNLANYIRMMEIELSLCGGCSGQYNGQHYRPLRTYL